MRESPTWCGCQACISQNRTWQHWSRPPAGRTAGLWITPLSTHRLHTTGVRTRSKRGQDRVRAHNILHIKKMNMRTLRLKHVPLCFLSGCYVSGLYLEGADWDIEQGCLVRSKPRVLVSQLPILKIIPNEAHRVKLQARPTVFFKSGVQFISEYLSGNLCNL